MGAVISATVFSLRDQGGTPRTLGYFTLEFRNAAYPLVNTGEGMGLGTYMRQIEQVTIGSVEFASGTFQGALARVNANDVPGPAASARFQLWAVTSGSALLNEFAVLMASGIAISGTRVNALIVGY